MKKIILRISNNGLAWNDDGVLPWGATNLHHAAFRFREREDIFWEVGMIGYIAAEGELHVRVTDYEADPDEFQPTLQPRQPVRQIRFAPLNGEALKSQLTYYRSGELEPLLAANPASVTSPAPAAAPPPEPAGGPQKTPDAQRGHAVNFTVPLLELTFGNGGVRGSTELPGLAEPVAFSIANDHLVAEFDAIKPYFARALKRKTIRVAATLEFRNDQPRIVNARSPQIAAINDEMLEVFRARAVRQLTADDTRRAVDQSLFTPEDIFASLDDDALGKATLPHDGHDLLAEILRHKNIRNARQLEFLAASVHPPGRKLRFVLSPKFGFVFLAVGQDGHHFILELLDSHATYVWSIPRDWKTPDEQIQAVGREIMAIGRTGRGQYRRTLHFEHDFWFVVHENAGSELVDGFPRWKNRLLEGLV